MKNFRFTPVDVSDEVATALSEARAVVALETTIVVHGLPAPVNIEVARECEDAVRASGATPATVAVVEGRIVVGVNSHQLEQLADRDARVAKVSSRDLGPASATGVDGATTVAGTIVVAHAVGISVMATGGLGGVHRDAGVTFDESADLTTLARTPVLVVASGVKSILDIGATLERLDTLGVAVVGFAIHHFPGFYLHDSGFSLDWSVDSVDDACEAFLRHRELSGTGFLLAHAVAKDRELDPGLHDEALAGALATLPNSRARGKDVTPALLGEFARLTAGHSVAVNRDLVVANARLAGDVAAAIAIASRS